MFRSIFFPGVFFQSFVLLLVVVLTLGTAEASEAEDDGLYYLHQGERVELEIDPDHLTVGLRPGAHLPTEQTVSAEPPIVARAEVLRGSAWKVTLADEGTPAKMGEASRRSRLVRQEAARQAFLGSEETAWSYPALRHRESGTLLFLTPQLIMRVAPDIDRRDLSDLLPHGLRLNRPLAGDLGIFLLELEDPAAEPLAVAGTMAEENDWILWAEPDFIQQMSLSALPDDPFIPFQWHVRNDGTMGFPPGVAGADAHLEGAWDTETGDDSVVIAVLDDGVELAHPDLQSRIFVNPGEIPDNGVDDDGDGTYVDDVNGWDFFDGDNDPNPNLSDPAENSHGTAVAGVAAAAGNNGTGVSGACWNCRILPVRLFNHGGIAQESAVAEAILYAARLADILNNSWGGGSPSNVITAAIQEVTDGGAGPPVFFASGNKASGFALKQGPMLLAGTYTFEWTYSKDSIISTGFDTAWLDTVLFNDGTDAIEGFEGCTDLPAGWSSSGDQVWTVVDDETRAASLAGGRCSVKAGTISHGQSTTLRVTKTLIGDPQPSVLYSAWVSSEGDPEDTCFDSLVLRVYDHNMDLVDTGEPSCGPNPISENVSYPASLEETIAVGAATNFDRRSSYSQFGPALDIVAHSNGGSLDIVTTAPTALGSYTDSFGGTSSATPLAAGIAGLLLSHEPSLTGAEVRSRLHQATRKIGPLPYVGGRNDNYGFGVLDADLLLDGAGCTPDTWEPDDEPAEASGLAPDVTQAHSICGAGDEDWAAFTLGSSASQWSVVVGTSGSGDDDTRLWLYGGGLDEIEYDDDGGSTFFSRIERTCASGALSPGLYFVKVDEFGDDDEIENYALDFTALPCPGQLFVDGFESGDTSAWDESTP